VCFSFKGMWVCGSSLRACGCVGLCADADAKREDGFCE